MERPMEWHPDRAIALECARRLAEFYATPTAIRRLPATSRGGYMVVLTTGGAALEAPCRP